MPLIKGFITKANGLIFTKEGKRPKTCGQSPRSNQHSMKTNAGAQAHLKEAIFDQVDILNV